METPEGWRGSPSNPSAEGQAPDVCSLVARFQKPTSLAVLATPSRCDQADRFP